MNDPIPTSDQAPSATPTPPRGLTLTRLGRAVLIVFGLILAVPLIVLAVVVLMALMALGLGLGVALLATVFAAVAALIALLFAAIAALLGIPLSLPLWPWW